MKKERDASVEILNEICNEMAQPLTTMTSLVELWERGLAESGDLELMKQELSRVNQALRELRLFSNAVKSVPTPTNFAGNLETGLPPFTASVTASPGSALI